MILLDKPTSKSREFTKYQPIGDSVFHNSEHQAIGTTSDADLDVDHRLESISYSNGRNRFNNCIHSKERRRYHGDTSKSFFETQVTTGYHYHTFFREHVLSNNAHDEAMSNYWTALDVDPLDYSSLSYEAMEKMKPDLNILSLPNFLLELDDIKKMFDFWSRTRNIRKNVSGLHLNWNFGWKPFIGDLQKIWSILGSVYVKLDKWQNDVQNGGLHVRHCTLLDEVNTYGGTFNFQGAYHRPCTWRATHKRVVTGHVKYRPLPLRTAPGLLTGLRGYMQALGFAPNVSIIWEAIPFSFVVDWFVDVGNYVATFDIDVLELPFELVDFCIQNKVEETIVSELGLNVGYSEFWVPEVKCARWETTLLNFQRRVMRPSEDALASLGWDAPNWRQALLGVSLVGANRR